MTNYRIGIDIGGTKVGLGLMQGDGSIQRSLVIPTPDFRGSTDTFFAGICSALQELLNQEGVTLSQVEGFGVGIPGTVDWKRGIVRYCPNLFGLVELPMADLFEKELGIRPSIVQDSWAAAYAEYEFGRQRQLPNMLCLTLGTGIGCGVILQGQVYGGALGTAGELGHTPIVFEGKPCPCGRLGCLERYVSGPAIFLQAMERFPEKLKGLPPKTESVFALAYQQDKDALALITKCVDKLAYGISLAIGLLAVDTVVISGGLCAHKALMVDPLEENIRRYAYPAWAKNTQLQVLQAALGSDAPMVGAAFLTQDHIRP